jgi:phosphotransferase system HPr-like phosphotransfer protein
LRNAASSNSGTIIGSSILKSQNLHRELSETNGDHPLPCPCPFLSTAAAALLAVNVAYLSPFSRALLVTLTSKKRTAGFWVDEDVLVVHPFGAVHVAAVLRQNLIDVHSSSISARVAERRALALMEYIKSDSFKNLVGDTIFRTVEVYEMLKKESKSHKKVWKTRFDHYRQIYDDANAIKVQTTGILHGVRIKVRIEGAKAPAAAINLKQKGLSSRTNLDSVNLPLAQRPLRPCPRARARIESKQKCDRNAKSFGHRLQLFERWGIPSTFN